MKGVVIVSGGLDSVTLAYYMASQFDWCGGWHYVSFNYGQRHVKELEYAKVCADSLNAQHHVVDLTSLTDLLKTSHSVLVDADAKVPEGHYAEESMKQTVVPNRNAIMLSIATGIAVAEGAEIVAAGMHAGDHPIYPDCRPEFVRFFSNTMRIANIGFWDGRVMAPFIYYSKAQIVSTAANLHVPFNLTWSCYRGGEIHCGRCSTCVERQEAFAIAKVDDPTTYDDPEFWKTVVQQ